MGSAAKIKDLTGKKVPYRMRISGVNAFEVLDSQFFQSCWAYRKDLSPGYDQSSYAPCLTVMPRAHMGQASDNVSHTSVSFFTIEPYLGVNSFVTRLGRTKYIKGGENYRPQEL